MGFKFTDENFQREVLEAEGLVVVDFYADWCGPCKMMAPIVEELAEEYIGQVKIGKMNVDDNPNVPGGYRIMSIPTMMFIKNGEVVDKIVGGIPKSELVEKIQQHR